MEKGGDIPQTVLRATKQIVLGREEPKKSMDCQNIVRAVSRRSEEGIGSFSISVSPGQILHLSDETASSPAW